MSNNHLQVRQRHFSRRHFIGRTTALGFSGAAASLLGKRLFRGKPAVASQASLSSAPSSIVEAGSRLRDGSLTAVTLTQYYLECIETLNPQLNAFITVTADQALERAAQLDAELRQRKDRGPLHGIPIVYKDIYNTAGTLTTVGSEFFSERIPEKDATTVERLRNAGTISLGKTNMNEFAAGVSGTNQYYGDTHNPWKLGYSPGGSSSGTGAAIAAGLCLGGTGTDTGGSIRVPAAWCGIVGIRPTYGLVSLEGIFPRAYSLDVAGPLAHTVTDVALLLDAMAGYDPNDPNSSMSQRRDSYAKGLEADVRGLRLGLIKNYTFRDVDPEVAAAIQAAADTFTDLGAEVVTIDIPLLSSGPLDYAALFDILLYEFNQILGDEFRAAENKDQFGSIVQNNIATGLQISQETYEKALEERPEQIAQLKAVYNEVDALLTPSLPMVAPLLTADSDIYARGRQFTLPFSFTALPSVSVPCGFNSEGLPIGLQIVGNHFEEALILRLAAALERATDFQNRRPPLYCEAPMS